MARPFERRSGPKGSLPHRLGRVRTRKLHAEWAGVWAGEREGKENGASEGRQGIVKAMSYK